MKKQNVNFEFELASVNKPKTRYLPKIEYVPKAKLIGHQTTNANFAKTDRIFHKACELAEITVTNRQASKYRRKTGKAFQLSSEAKLKFQEIYEALKK